MSANLVPPKNSLQQNITSKFLTTMVKIKIAGQTQIHEGQPEKPNEDGFISNGSTFAAIADGISRSNKADGTYPSEKSIVVPNALLQTLFRELSGSVVSTASMRRSFVVANEEINQINGLFGITVDTVDYQANDYFGTTGISLHVDLETGKAILAYVGDPIAIYLPKDGQPVLLTKDQLHSCHNFSYGHFASLVSPEFTEKQAKAARLLFQRKDARNQPKATDPGGNLIGFGALTGEDSALHFLEVMELQLKPGDKLMLASDALRASAQISGHEDETVFSYERAIEVIETTSFEGIPAALIELTRQYEKLTNARSDDATFVMLEIL